MPQADKGNAIVDDGSKQAELEFVGGFGTAAKRKGVLLRPGDNLDAVSRLSHA